MKIGGFDKLTVQDYPEHIACIIFTKGCNFDCSYCYNRDLVDNKSKTIDKEEIMEPQMARYRAENYPKNNGLVQTNIMFRKHNEEDCMRHGSRACNHSCGCR